MTWPATVSFVRRWWWLLALGALAAALTIFAVSVASPAVYESRATLLVGPTDLSPGLTADQVTTTYAELIRTRPIVNAAAAALGLSAEEVAAAVDASPVRDTRFIQLRARSTDAGRAAAIANQVAATAAEQLQAARAERAAGRVDRVRVVVDRVAQELADRQQQVRTLQGTSPNPQRDVQLAIALNDLSRAQQRLTSANAALDEARLAQAATGDVLTVTEPAAPPSSPVLPRVAVNVVSAAVVGVLLAIGVGLFVDVLLARRPRPGTTIDTRPRGVVVVTGADDLADATATALRTAETAARAGDRVVVIDANLRQPELAQRLSLENRHGLADLLADPSATVSTALQRTAIDNVTALVAGGVTAASIDLLDSERMRGIIQLLRAEADVVLVIGAPAETSDALALLGPETQVALAV